MIPIRAFVRRMSIERTLNRVTLLGRAGADAQLRGTVEHPVVIFNMATTSGSKTEWHRISIFKPTLRTLAESYVKSGSRLLVEGKLSHGHIIDNQGNAVPTTSIIADDIVFLSKSSRDTQQEENEDILENNN